VCSRVARCATSWPNTGLYRCSSEALTLTCKNVDGVPDNVVRTVSENCRTLNFISQGFEEE